MKAKSKLGLGLKKKAKTKSKSKKTIKQTRKKKSTEKKSTRSVLHTAIAKAKQVLQEKRPETMERAVSVALNAARTAIKTHGEKPNSDSFRVIQIPKEGGALPLLAIFAALSAIGLLILNNENRHFAYLYSNLFLQVR